jgi:hypothetical protein
MCFSATVSFTTAAVLLPSGMYCLTFSNQIDRRYRVFAILPFMFGLQQTLDGALWLAMEQGDAREIHRYRPVAGAMSEHCHVALYV